MIGLFGGGIAVVFMQRADLRVMIQWVALLQFGGGVFHALHHLVSDGVLHKDARSTQAHLTRVIVLFNHVLQSEVEVGTHLLRTRWGGRIPT